MPRSGVTGRLAALALAATLVAAGDLRAQPDALEHEAALAEALRNPLSPPRTASPRETLLGFVTAIRAAYEIADEADAETHSMTALRRAARALDLSQEPPQIGEHRGVEIALTLKEVFDRIPMPPLDAVPGGDPVARARGADETNGEEPVPTRWVIPGTEIAMVRLDDGAAVGQWLFSAETVARADEFYDRVRDRPYLAAFAGEDGDGVALPDYAARNFTPGVLRAYISTPGDGLVFGWGRSLPAWSTWIVFGQTVWQWMATALLLAAALTLTPLALRLAMAREATLREARDADEASAARPVWRWRLLTALGVSIAVISVVRYLIFDVVNITGAVLIVLLDALILLCFPLIAWFVALLIGQLALWVVVMRRLPLNSPDSHLIRFAGRFLALVAIVAVIVLAAQRIGLPVYSVVTGLGIGGLAVAFAAQQSLGAMFGSIMIMMDRPFRVGDHIVMDGVEGVVEDIGFRSTLIRTLHDSVLSVPNSQMATATVDNLGLRTWRRVRAEIEIRDDTPTETVQAFLDRIRAIIAETPEARSDRADVVVAGFGAVGLLILIEFFLKVPDRSARRRLQQEMFLKLLAAADALGVRFAPNQALDVAMTGLDAVRPGAGSASRAPAA